MFSQSLRVSAAKSTSVAEYHGPTEPKQPPASKVCPLSPARVYPRLLRTDALICSPSHLGKEEAKKGGHEDR